MPGSPSAFQRTSSPHGHFYRDELNQALAQASANRCAAFHADRGLLFAEKYTFSDPRSSRRSAITVLLQANVTLTMRRTPR